MKKLNIENIESVFDRVIETEGWIELQSKFNDSQDIYLAGNGGNLAVADHGAIDMTRHTDKNIICAGSAILATSIINDFGFDGWMSKWMEFRLRGKTPQQISSSLFLGVSASGTSKNVVDAMEWSSAAGLKTGIIAARPLFKEVKDSATVCLNVSYYHTAEVLTLALFYQLIMGAGFSCPKIKGL